MAKTTATTQASGNWPRFTRARDGRWTIDGATPATFTTAESRHIERTARAAGLSVKALLTLALITGFFQEQCDA